VRYFNTTGPCVPERHYMLPAAARLPEALPLIERSQYFVVHAPRQTGKTTTLNALARQLSAEGRHVALRFSCESAQAAGDDYGAAELQVLEAIRAVAEAQLPPERLPPDPWPDAPPGTRLAAALRDWAAVCPLPLVLFFDEIDALRGQSLISVLRQLRDGFTSFLHPQAFPASVVLCGLRDVRDYKAAAGGDPSRLGTASPFNIVVDSLRIGDFTADEVATLYKQHTAETGKEFTSEAIERVFTLTQGQPWLVNALAREVIEKMGVEPQAPITAEHVDTAKERLILARATHLDSLVSKLAEPRVRRVIEPLVAGTLPDDVDDVYEDDVSYVQDLGLIARGKFIQVANPIYREVIMRVLGSSFERLISAEPRWFLLSDGRLDFRLLVEKFAEFWVSDGEILAETRYYSEASAQLVFTAFLQRVVNGGGTVDREYGIGRARIDLLIRKPYGDGLVQREAVELKVWHPRKADPLPQGLAQLDGYLDRLGLDAGTLIIFDRRPDAAPVTERTALTETTSPAGHAITLLRA
jgi:AAA ATPase domain